MRTSPTSPTCSWSDLTPGQKLCLNSMQRGREPAHWIEPKPLEQWLHDIYPNQMRLVIESQIMHQHVDAYGSFYRNSIFSVTSYFKENVTIMRTNNLIATPNTQKILQV